MAEEAVPVQEVSADEALRDRTGRINRGAFRKGVDKRRHEERGIHPLPPGVVLPAVVEPAGAANPVLSAYRFVLANVDGRVDRTVLEREAREYLKEHRKEFLARYSELEDEEFKRKAAQAAEAKVESGMVDPGEAAARAILERLISEWEAEHGDE